jgi:hypothetical protein
MALSNGFTQEHFKQFSQQLQVIIMSRRDLDPMTNFKSLEPKQKRLFNEDLNAYIRALPCEFESYITEEFNRVCQEEIFPFMNTKYKGMIVRPSNETELSKETKEYTELLWNESIMDGKELTQTQIEHRPIVD